MKGKILAIDYGEKRTGIAISDELGIMARPYKVVKAETTEELLSQVKGIVLKEEVKKIIIGYPRRLNGKKSEITFKVEKFAKELRKQIPKHIPIIFYDERLTSKMVERLLIQRGVDLRRNKELVDLYAAVYLLQEYMDFNKEPLD